jgi:uncharacterized protein YjiK
VWVLSERTSAIYALRGDLRGADPALEPPVLVGELEHIGKSSNKGWEGIALRPGKFQADGVPRLIAVHENKPKLVGVFSAALETEALLKLPKPIRKALDDLSDVCVHPDNGNLLLLSDESAAIVEVELAYDGDEVAELIEVERLELDVGKKEKPEGLCIDELGILWVVTDGDPHVRSYERV